MRPFYIFVRVLLVLQGVVHWRIRIMKLNHLLFVYLLAAFGIVFIMCAVYILFFAFFLSLAAAR